MEIPCSEKSAILKLRILDYFLRFFEMLLQKNLKKSRFLIFKKM